MNKFLIKGIVIIFFTMPFLFTLSLNSQIKFTLKDNSLGMPVRLSGNYYYYADSLRTDSAFTKNTPKDKTSKKFRMKKSPTTAVLLSAVLPGAGQYYNESYWKIPIIAGLVGYFGYEYFRQNNFYKDYRDQYAASQTVQNPSGDLNLKTLREFYRSQRDDFVWYFTIIYVINLVDAYIDAHLFDFDVRDESLGTGNVHRTYNFRVKLIL